MPNGLTIKELRLNNRMTQKEFADSVGVFWTTISKWERNERIPKPETIRKIEEMYKIKLNY